MTSPPFSVARLIPTVIGPAMIMEIGIGAITPVLAFSATGMGAGIGLAGLAIALLGVGQILGDIPAGLVTAKFGERLTLAGTAVLLMAALAGAALASSLWLLFLTIALTGFFNAVWMLARQSYVTDVTPVLFRARALSTLGGLQRAGLFVGPFLGAWLITMFGQQAPFWLAIGAAAVAGVLVLVNADSGAGRAERRQKPERGVESASATPVQAAKQATTPVAMRTVFRDSSAMLRTLGIAVIGVGAVRGVRQAVIPVWAAHIGLDVTTASLLYGLAGALDMLAFYPGGRLMDRRGRLWVAIPALSLMGVGLFIIPFTTGAFSLAIAAVVLGLGNGTSSGMLMTLAADVAPAHQRQQFLGIWRLLQDAGNAGGPLLLAAGGAVGVLGPTVAGFGLLSFGSAAGMWRWVPRWSVHANRTTRKQAGVTRFE